MFVWTLINIFFPPNQTTYALGTEYKHNKAEICYPLKCKHKSNWKSAKCKMDIVTLNTY